MSEPLFSSSLLAFSHPHERERTPHTPATGDDTQRTHRAADAVHSSHSASRLSAPVAAALALFLTQRALASQQQQTRMANAVERTPEERLQWIAQLKAGDLVDWYSDYRRWHASQIVSSTATHFTVHQLFWTCSHDEEIERTSERLQPLFSKAKGQYAGPPRREKYVMIGFHVPRLQAVTVPLHPQHRLQRFQFDFIADCRQCKQIIRTNKPTYTCLVCCYDLCTRCFVDAGGVDTHPLPCEAPPAKQIELKNFQQVEFVEDLNEHQCAVCLSAAYKPVSLPECGQCAETSRDLRAALAPSADSLSRRCVCLGHLFCLDCLSRVNPKKCPTCRSAFTASDLKSSAFEFAERQISSKKARCLNHAAGCHWTGELGAEAKGLSDHLQACEHRTFECPRCQTSIKVGDAKQHAELECLIRVPIPIKQEQLARHKRKREEDEEEQKEQEEELMQTAKKHRFSSCVQ
jgi:hypothetical protein